MGPACLTVVAILLCIMSLAQAQNSPEDYLNLHNAARDTVGVGPMKWDQVLEKYAQDYAQKRSKDCQLIHSGGPYGENIYWGQGDESYTSAEAAIKWWLNEKQYYDYSSNTCSPGQECLHYTQILWRDSVRLGCARASCGNDRYFITCNYDPPGNFVGQHPY